MPATRLLYLSPAGIVLYRWRAGVLSEEARFQQSDEHLARFAAHVAPLRSSVFHVLLDVVEEGFHIDMIPFVRGADRKALIQRRLAQRFRDISLSTCISLGYEKTQRREERVLLTAFTNTADYQPWLDALQRAEVPVSGVYTPALLAADLARRLKLEKPRMLVVGVHRCGVRQTFVEHRRPHFSRLNPLSGDDLGSPAARTAALERETTRLYEYLRGTQDVGNENEVLDALIIAPRGEARRVHDFSTGAPPQLRMEVIDGLDAARRIGLKQAPDGTGVEALYLHLLARKRPAQQYASALVRASYGIRSWQVGLVAGGAAVGAACLAAAGLQLFQAYQLNRHIAEDETRLQAATLEHDAIARGLPPLPTTLEKLRVVLSQYQALRTASIGPESLAIELSRALDTSPQVRLERLEWTNETPPISASEGNPTARREAARISATLTDTRAGDYRRITGLVDDFSAALKQRAGFTVSETKLPFAMTADTSVSSDGATRQNNAAPPFNLTVRRGDGS